MGLFFFNEIKKHKKERSLLHTFNKVSCSTGKPSPCGCSHTVTAGRGCTPKAGHSAGRTRGYCPGRRPRTPSRPRRRPQTGPRPRPSRQARALRPAPRYLLAVLPVPHQAHLPVAALPHGSEEAVGSQGHPPAARAGPGQRLAAGAPRCRPPGGAAAATIEIPPAPRCHREHAAAACRAARRASLWYERSAAPRRPFWKRVRRPCEERAARRRGLGVAFPSLRPEK